MSLSSSWVSLGRWGGPPAQRGSSAQRGVPSPEGGPWPGGPALFWVSRDHLRDARGNNNTSVKRHSISCLGTPCVKNTLPLSFDANANKRQEAKTRLTKRSNVMFVVLQQKENCCLPPCIQCEGFVSFQQNRLFSQYYLLIFTLKTSMAFKR